MSPWWAVAVGGAVGTAIGVAIIQDARASAAFSKIVDEVRLPEPSFEMQLPRSAAEFSTLESVVCECVRTVTLLDDGQPTTQPSSAGAVSEDERHEAVVLCVAKRLYPTFPWPPMAGDNPTVAELWANIDALAWRAVAVQQCAPQMNPVRPRRRRLR